MLAHFAGPLRPAVLEPLPLSLVLVPKSSGAQGVYDWSGLGTLPLVPLL